ncbi:hypothetical protein UVI_02015970 [Ustilaginoidea virens]|nr:hypothetical protein UVI_02015970 [Ustilaginoidea virens]
MVDAKPKFDGLVFLSPVVLGDLEMQRDASRDLGQALVAKLPASWAAVAKSLVKGVDDAFAAAIDKYSVFAV